MTILNRTNAAHSYRMKRLKGRKLSSLRLSALLSSSSSSAAPFLRLLLPVLLAFTMMNDRVIFLGGGTTMALRLSENRSVDSGADSSSTSKEIETTTATTTSNTDRSLSEEKIVPGVGDILRIISKSIGFAICRRLPDFLCDEDKDRKEFIVTGDDLTNEWLSYNCPSYMSNGRTFRQLSVLTEFYFSTRRNSKDDEIFNANLDRNDWLQGCNPCSWDGVACFGTNVIELSLPGNKMENGPLQGTLPSSMNLMPTLTGLDLKGNEIGGTIPDDIGPFLVFLDLSENKFNGTLPAGLTSAVTMQVNLSHNEISGTIPEDFFDKLPLIEKLDLSYNRLHGIFPESEGTRLKRLNELNLHNNTINGTIPLSICQHQPDRISIDCDTVSCGCCSGCN